MCFMKHNKQFHKIQNKFMSTFSNITKDFPIYELENVQKSEQRKKTIQKREV